MLCMSTLVGNIVLHIPPFCEYLLYDCVSQLHFIGQLEGNISLYCPLVIARAYRDARYCPCL